MNSTRGTVILACVISVFLASSAGNLNASPILSINANLVDTSFVPTGGSFGLGVLTVEKTTAVTVVRTDGTLTTTDFFSLVTDLQTDLSSSGLADGSFSGGTITLKSSDLLTTLLTGDIQVLELKEPLDNKGILSGGGTFVVTGGDFQADFGNAGRVVDITFHVVPQVMNDFSETFTGTSDLTMTPLLGGDVPEPATLLLVGTGALGLCGYFVRRRMR